MKRSLRLTKEHLTELTVEDLRAVAGADGVQTTPPAQCVSRLFMTCTCCTGTASCE